MPASADDIVAYAGAGVQTRSDYAALDSRSVSPFDISSPYSTVSRLAVQIWRQTTDEYIAGLIYRKVPPRSCQMQLVALSPHRRLMQRLLIPRGSSSAKIKTTRI